MWVFLLRRTLQSVVVMLIVTFICFCLSHLMPGDMWSTVGLSPQQYVWIQEQKHLLGLDMPVYLQYFQWLKGLSGGYLGIDYNYRPIDSYIWQYVENSLILFGTAWLFTLMIALPWGIYNSRKPYGISDRVAAVLGVLCFCLPAFIIGRWLQYFIALELSWLPPSSMHEMSKEGDLWDLAKHMILPVITVSMGMLAYYLKFVRNGMMEVLHADYLMTARAKGASERRVIYKHALKNAMIPLITLVGLDLPAIVSGSAIVEFVFNWRGLGYLMVDSARSRNLPVLLAVIMIVAGFVIVSNWIADLLYSLVDPRVRLKGKAEVR
ncbi:ABC transporter permease [Paenibacillus chibensis]|uniref:ABC transporter permease n=1 Tax=Paenibacillus chibensis TaxID=59846 RepID=UPI000FDB727D|nr:ABC transporter permease [Paenibacillus chibensis]MEC0369823.1 ABC transporter permease [Paenibacillus chibensis]